MERKISLADIQNAVSGAYEKYKTIDEGSLKADVACRNADSFGVSVVLTDGTVINKGDTDELSPLGSIAKIAVATVLLGQKSPDDECCCNCCGGHGKEKPHTGVSARGVRAVSMVEPRDDRDGKMDILSSTVRALLGGEPVLDDRLYEHMRRMEADEKAVDRFAAAGYTLYDDTDTSLDIYTRLISLQANAEQIATLGATVAADGRNPKTGEEVFDSSLAARIVTMVALHGPHHEKKEFAFKVGLPTKRGYAGTLLAIMPGFGAIAVYAPRLDENGVSIKGSKALEYIARTLGLNVYASARVTVDN